MFEGKEFLFVFVFFCNRSGEVLSSHFHIDCAMLRESNEFIILYGITPFPEQRQFKIR